MSQIPESVRQLAEDVIAYSPLGEGDQRIVTAQYVLCLRLTPGPRSTMVTRLRLGAGEAAAVVREVRARLRKAGRQKAHWEVGSSATPATLAAELLALGLTPAAPPFTLTQALVLPGVPPRIGELPPTIQITEVTTQADFRRSQELFWRCFDFVPDTNAEAEVERDFVRFTHNPTLRRYLAWHDDQVVAVAAATLTPEAIVLHGGATLPAWRGRGIYRALIWTRWQAALRRGTPYLVTQAGSLSAPVLTRVGFVATAQIQNFFDQVP